jgi:hypothetical protein
MAEDNKLDCDVITRLAIYFPILLQLARNRGTIFYSTLQDTAGKNEFYLRVENIEVGQTLEWFRLFTDPRNLPDICALVVNKKKQSGRASLTIEILMMSRRSVLNNLTGKPKNLRNS